MAEQLRLHQGGREGGDIDGEEPAVVGERETLIVEGHVAGLRDGARDQFLAGAGWAGDERGELAHARVERAAVAADIVGEDGLPDGGAQARGRHGAADDVAEYLLEGALDLAEAGEGVAGIVAGGEVHALDVEEVRASRPGNCCKSASGPDRFGRRQFRKRRRRNGGSNADRAGAGPRLHTAPGRTGGPPRPRGGGPGAAAARVSTRSTMRQTLARGWFGIADVLAPDGLARDEVVAQRGALEFHPFGQERVGVGQLGDGARGRRGFDGVRKSIGTFIVR